LFELIVKEGERGGHASESSAAPVRPQTILKLS
jgi:hypothetical protein